MKITVNLSSTFPNGIEDEELDSLKEALEQEIRFSGGYGVVIEVEKS